MHNLNANNRSICIYSFFKRFYLFTFYRQGKGRKKRERETSMCKRYINGLPLTHPQLGTWPTTQAYALTGNQTGNLGSWASAQSTEPHQPGPKCIYSYLKKKLNGPYISKSSFIFFFYFLNHPLKNAYFLKSTMNIPCIFQQPSRSHPET